MQELESILGRQKEKFNIVKNIQNVVLCKVCLYRLYLRPKETL